MLPPNVAQGMSVACALLLCLAALAFPFSVAVTNVALGVTLAVGVVSGLWWRGALLCWQQARLLALIFLGYFLLMLFGLAWSADKSWGVHVLGRHWFWLLVPVAVAALADRNWRRYFLAALSTGLGLNLIYCVLQMFGYVVVTTDGSSAGDATGHIGHIGFGFVYGTWAAWLLLLGLRWLGWQRWLAWGLAAWSYVLIFSAQGRSGYLVALLLAVAALLQWFRGRGGLRLVFALIGVMTLAVTAFALGPGKDRIVGTLKAFSTAQDRQLNQLESADNATLATRERFKMWSASLEIWRNSPLLGVGTGGFPVAAVEQKVKDRYGAPFTFVHPHNQYLLNLVRWGVVGLALLLLFLFFWVREGWRPERLDTLAGPFMLLSGLALAIHGLASSSLEEHFSAMLAALLLGTALSEKIDKTSVDST